jgi:hypothetical protein
MNKEKYVCEHVCVYVYIYIYICPHFMCIHIYVYMYVCIPYIHKNSNHLGVISHLYRSTGSSVSHNRGYCGTVQKGFGLRLNQAQILNSLSSGILGKFPGLSESQFLQIKNKDDYLSYIKKYKL